MLNVFMLSVIMLSVIMLNLIMLNVIILSVIMPNVFRLSVIMMIVMSPFLDLSLSFYWYNQGQSKAIVEASILYKMTLLKTLLKLGRQNLGRV